MRLGWREGGGGPWTVQMREKKSGKEGGQSKAEKGNTGPERAVERR